MYGQFFLSANMFWYAISLGCMICGCAYYDMRQEFAKSPSMATVSSCATPVSSVLSAASNAVSMAKEEAEKKEFYERMLEKSQALPDLTLPKNFPYDFESEAARRWRSMASDDKVSEIVSHEISLDSLLCLAYQRNPDIENLRKRWRAVQQRYSQSAFLYDLADQYSSFTRTLELSTGMGMQNPKIADQTPFPRTFALMGEVIASEIKISYLQYVMGMRDLLFQITKDYLDLLFIQNAILIEKEHLEILNALESSVREKFKAGLVGYGDVLKAQTAKSQLELDLETYRLRYKTLETHLLTAIYLPPTTVLKEPARVDFKEIALHLEDLYLQAQKNRLEIAMMELQIQKQNQMIAMATSELYPTFTLGLSYYENKAGERAGSGERMESFSEKPAQEPRFMFGQSKSYIREMEIEKEAMEKQLQQIIYVDTVAQIRDIYYEWDTARRSEALYQKSLIPLSQETLKTMQNAYQAPGGQVDFLDVLDAQRMLLNLRLTCEQSKKEYGLKLAELEKVVGIKLWR